MHLRLPHVTPALLLLFAASCPAADSPAAASARWRADLAPAPDAAVTAALGRCAADQGELGRRQEALLQEQARLDAAAGQLEQFRGGIESERVALQRAVDALSAEKRQLAEAGAELRAARVDMEKLQRAQPRPAGTAEKIGFLAEAWNRKVETHNTRIADWTARAGDLAARAAAQNAAADRFDTQARAFGDESSVFAGQWQAWSGDMARARAACAEGREPGR
ncbi:MAG: hypothetical protein WCJ69_13305 [Betaproteobacteria bacterium]